MVVECIGLPGSGKTYLIGKLQEALEEKGIPVVNASDSRANRIIRKAAVKLLRAGVIPDREAGELRSRLREILADGEPRGSRFGIYEDTDYTGRSAAAFVQRYRKMMHSPKVYLFDEGLVHALVKLCADFGISNEIFLSMAGETEKRLAGRRLVIYNVIPTRDCLASIAERNRHICAFDELSGEELKEILGEYERLNGCYAEHYDTVEVRREEEDRRKTERILERILPSPGNADQR